MKKKIFETYGDYARQWAKQNGIRLRSLDNTVTPWDNRFIYINRIGDKTRILTEADNMRNVIKITWDTEKFDPDFMRYFIQAKIPHIDRLRMGSCQKFMRQSTLLEILAGVYDKRLQSKRELLYTEI